VYPSEGIGKLIPGESSSASADETGPSGGLSAGASPGTANSGLDPIHENCSYSLIAYLYISKVAFGSTGDNTINTHSMHI